MTHKNNKTKRYIYAAAALLLAAVFIVMPRSTRVYAQTQTAVEVTGKGTGSAEEDGDENQITEEIGDIEERTNTEEPAEPGIVSEDIKDTEEAEDPAHNESAFSTDGEELPGLQEGEGGEEEDDIEQTLLETVGEKREADSSEENWYLSAIDAQEAWQLSKGSGVKVAIIDTGVDLSHPDLQGAVVFPERVIPDSAYAEGGLFASAPGHATAEDYAGHGTHLAGIIHSIAPEAVILSIKALDTASGSSVRGAGRLAWVSDGVNRAVEEGADVINLSIGTSRDISYSSLSTAIMDAVNTGVTVICAVGNNGRNSILYPAAFPETIAVMAVDESLNRASFSNYGTGTDIAAPGTRIYSTWIGEGYRVENGTSQAAAIVSGTIADLLSYARESKKDLSSGQVRNLMEESANDMGDPGPDEVYGYGLIKAGKLLNTFQKQYLNLIEPEENPSEGRQMNSDTDSGQREQTEDSNQGQQDHESAAGMTETGDDSEDEASGNTMDSVKESPEEPGNSQMDSPEDNLLFTQEGSHASENCDKAPAEKGVHPQKGSWENENSTSAEAKKSRRYAVTRTGDGWWLSMITTILGMGFPLLALSLLWLLKNKT